MGLLTKELNNIIRSDNSEYGYQQEQKCFNTCFKIFDYSNGTVDYSDGKPIFNVGIDGGKNIEIIGKAGSGKSSFSIQLIYSIMKKYSESTLYIYDFEQSHTKARIKSITGMDDEYFDDHVTILSTGIYTESVLKLIKQIAAFKTSKETKEKLLTENKEGIYDKKTGELVKVLPPTFVMIDSVASMRTRDAQDGDEMSSLTAGARNAIANKDFLNRILQPCMEANIILVAINHITDNVSMNMTPPVALTRYLKNTESISGGKAFAYLPNLILKIEAGPKLEEKDKYGIKGFVATITIVKSRNSEGGKDFEMVFNQKEGFDEDLSEFEFLKKNNKIKGAGIGLYLANLDTVKFRMSNLKEKLQSDPVFRQKYDELVLETLKETTRVSSKIDTSTNEVEVEHGPELLLEENKNTDSVSETVEVKENLIN